MGCSHLICSLGTKDFGKTSFDVNPDMLPHLLIGGAQGQGKSVLLGNILLEMMEKYSPEEVKFILFDPSRLEFLSFDDLPHLFCPVINEPERFMQQLGVLESEIQTRLKIFASVRCRNLLDFNAREGAESDGQPRSLPFIFVVADDVSDLIADFGDKVSQSIRRLTSFARAAGVHLVFSTRGMDPMTMRGLSVNVFPARIAFQTWSAADSVALIGTEDATHLTKAGDFIYRRGIDGLIRCTAKTMTFTEMDKKLEIIRQKGLEKQTSKDSVRFWR